MFEYESSELTFYTKFEAPVTAATVKPRRRGEVLPAAGHFQTQALHNVGAHENESYLAQYCFRYDGAGNSLQLVSGCRVSRVVCAPLSSTSENVADRKYFLLLCCMSERKTPSSRLTCGTPSVNVNVKHRLSYMSSHAHAFTLPNNKGRTYLKAPNTNHERIFLNRVANFLNNFFSLLIWNLANRL